MADKDSGDKQPWVVPVLIALVSATSAVIVAWVSKPQQPVTQPTPSPQAVSTSPSIQPSSSPAKQNPDLNLTGVWESQELGGATFYVRQVESTVWWYGQGPDWAHVLEGTLSEDGKTISARWANVPAPRGGGPNFGETKIDVVSQTEMHATDNKGVQYTLHLVTPGFP